MTADLGAFLEDVRGFLGAHATRRDRSAGSADSDRVAIIDEYTPEEERRVVEAARAWQRTKYDAGWGWVSGPQRYGGRGLPWWFEQALDEVEAGYDVPDQACLMVGLQMVAPTILAHGTAAQRDRYLPALHAGDVVACQMFSEPGAGSDLAAVATRAARDGDVWRITGQKVWTSNAHNADIGMLLARSDPQAARHQGLTMFLLDMTAGGVEVRALRQMTGGSSFCEVFLDAVVVPDDHRVGEVGDGWKVAMTTLGNERAALSGGASTAVPIDRLAALVHSRELSDDPHVLDLLGAAEVAARALTLTTQRATERMRAGEAPGPELSAGKFLLRDARQAVVAVLQAVLGPDLGADTGEWGTFAWTEFVLGAPATRIAGGTDEILLDVLASRVLGLPRDGTSTVIR